MTLKTLKVQDPDKDCIAYGSKYGCQIDHRADGHSGVVRDVHGFIRWRYGMSYGTGEWSLKNPFTKPDFIFTDQQTGAEVVIRRVSFIPSCFSVSDSSGIIGYIRLCSILRNAYLIQDRHAGLWLFSMPLFSVRFYGGSQESTDFWVIVGPSKMEWSILVRPGIKEQPLLSALSFIHTEWWNYS